MKPTIETIANHPIALAVLPLKARAMDRAEKEALNEIELVRSELTAVEWDIQKCAPYPNTNQSRVGYHTELAKYKLFTAVTETAPGFRQIHHRGPHIVVMSYKRMATFTKQARDNAAFQYDAFVLKLVGKVGEVKSAELNGCHVWGYSILKITKADGSQENWKTQMIVNRSKLGTLFNQFPSRKVK